MTDAPSDWVSMNGMIEAVARALCCYDENHPEAWENTNGRERVMWRANAMVAIDAVKRYLDEELGDD